MVYNSHDTSDTMHLYVIKRKYTNTYYTVRNNNNIPSVMAFPYAKPAKIMLKTITSCERHPQPLAVEKVDEDFLKRTCKASLLPVILFTQHANLELFVSNEEMSHTDAVFYLENKSRYF